MVNRCFTKIALFKMYIFEIILVFIFHHYRNLFYNYILYFLGWLLDFYLAYRRVLGLNDRWFLWQFGHFFNNLNRNILVYLRILLLLFLVLVFLLNHLVSDFFNLFWKLCLNLWSAIIGNIFIFTSYCLLHLMLLKVVNFDLYILILLISI